MHNSSLETHEDLQEIFNKKFLQSIINVSGLIGSKLSSSVNDNSHQIYDQFKFRDIQPESLDLNNYSLLEFPLEENLKDYQVIRFLLFHSGIINSVGICVENDKIFICQEKYSETLDNYIKLKNQKPFKYFLRMILPSIKASLMLISKGFFNFFIEPENLVLVEGKHFAINNFGEKQMRFEYEAPEYIFNKERTAESITWSFACLIFYIDTKHHPTFRASQSNREIRMWVLTKGYKKMIDHSTSPFIKILLQKVFKINRNKRMTLDQLYSEIVHFINSG